MSLYFNWSCDFQRFTKSKKLSKFQVRTTTLFISNKSLSTSLFNLQGTICCFALVSELFSSSTLADSLFSIPQYAPNVNTFLQLFSKKFYRKFVHSIYTYIIYSSCLNVLKIKHHLPLYTDNRGNCALLCVFSAVCNMYRTYKKFFLYQKSRNELVHPNLLWDFVYFLCCLCDTAVLSCKYQDLTTQNLYGILLPAYELAYDNSL